MEARSAVAGSQSMARKDSKAEFPDLGDGRQRPQAGSEVVEGLGPGVKSQAGSIDPSLMPVRLGSHPEGNTHPALETTDLLHSKTERVDLDKVKSGQGTKLPTTYPN